MNTLKELQAYFAYHHLPDPIGTGVKGRVLKIDYLNKLNSFKHFNTHFSYFLQLPEDLQSEIFKLEGLRYLFRLSKTVGPTLALSFYERYQSFKITTKQYNYCIQQNPEKLLVKCTSNQYRMYTKLYSNHGIAYHSQSISQHGKMERGEVLPVYDYGSTFDLLNTYLIYKRRQCEKIKPGYAKNKVLLELNNIKNPCYYSCLYDLYLWLRLNAKLFNLVVNKNKFKYNVVTNEKLIYSLKQTNIKDLLVELEQEVLTLKRKLVEAITQYDILHLSCKN